MNQVRSNSVTVPSNKTENTHLTGYFCLGTVFNLSKRVLTDAKIKVLENGLNNDPTQNMINEPELKTDFDEFCGRMRLKWYFCNDATPKFSEVSAFRPKST